MAMLKCNGYLQTSATSDFLKNTQKQLIFSFHFQNCDLVYKFRKIYVCNHFSTLIRKIVLRYIKIGYNINVIRQTACIVVNPISVSNFASLFGCTPAGLASYYMMAPA